MKNLLTVTELSELTGKSRPTMYKYLTLYDDHNLNDIPYPFIELFDFIQKKASNKQDVYKYCEGRFISSEADKELLDVINLIKNNREKLQLKELYDEIIEKIEGVNHGQ